MPQTINDMAVTWANSLTTFSAIKMNVQDSASAAASLLMDLQVGGSPKFRVTKAGDLDLNATAGSITAYPAGGSKLSGSVASNGLAFYAGNTPVAGVYSPISGFYIGSAASGVYSVLTAKAAANLRLGAADAAGPVAQTLSVQSVVAGTTDTAGANLTITGSQGTGTGAGGSIVFQVAPAGTTGTAQNALATALTIAGDRQVGSVGNVNAPNYYAIAGGTIGGTIVAYMSSSSGGGIITSASGRFAFSNTNSNAAATEDLILARDAANTLAQRNGTNAQTKRLYGTFTDSSNYRRLAMTMSTAGVAEIKPEGAGTGASGNVVHISGLPTSNPGPGILWNNAGTPAIGT